MAANLSPAINISEKDFTQEVPAVTSSVGAIVMHTLKGPVNVRTLLTTPKDLETIFGQAGDINYTHWFTAEAFLKQSNQLYAVRVENNGKAVAGLTVGLSANGLHYAILNSATSKPVSAFPVHYADVKMHEAKIDYTLPAGSSTNNYGSLGSAATVVGSAAYVTGKFGNAVNLANTPTNTNNVPPTNYVVIPTTNFAANGSYSFCCWFYFTTYSSSIIQTPWSTTSGANYGGSYPWISIYTSTGFFYLNVSYVANAATTVSVSTNTWYHAVITVSGGTVVTLYINGVSAASVSTASSIYYNNIMLGGAGIGSAGASSTPFAGYIDDFRVYNRVLSTTEITALYNLTSIPTLNAIISASNPRYPLYNTVQPITSTPAIHYPFQKDLNDYATIGGANTTLVGTIQYVPGVNGGRALYLNNNVSITGPTNYVYIASPGLVNTNSYTFSCWVNFAAFGYSGNGVTVYNISSGNTAVGGSPQLQLSATGIIGYSFAGIVGASSGVQASLNTWYFCTLVSLSGTTLQLYVNGNYTSSLTGATTSYTGGIFIGGYSITQSVPFQGYIDDFRIYNRVLTATEIAALYNYSAQTPAIAPYAVPTTYSASNIMNGLTAQYRYNNSSAPGYDASYNSNILTMTGTAAASATVYKADGYSLSLTGNATAGGTATAYATSAILKTMPARNFTISTWVYPTIASGTNSQMLVNVGTATSVYGASIYLNGTNIPQLAIQSSSSTSQTVGSTSAIPTNTWSHVAAVHSAQSYATNPSMSLYVNGSLAAGPTSLTLPCLSNISSIRIGADLLAANAFTGYVADTRIYNRPLAASEISSLYGLYATNTVTPAQNAVTYNQSQTLVSSGLVTYLPFDGNVLDVASPGSSNSIITYGTTPLSNSTLASNITFVTPSIVGNSALYIANPLNATGAGQQSHIDVSLQPITGALSIATWFQLSKLLIGSTPAIFNFGSISANSTNGILLSIANEGQGCDFQVTGGCDFHVTGV